MLAATYTFINPGGAFISLIHTLLPAGLLLVSFAVLFCGYEAASLRQRLVRFGYFGLAAALLVLIVMGTYYTMKEPFARGYLFGI